MERYYLGLDMGTSSVGWAVTDEKYQIVRKKGKDLWGVRLFPEAQTAAERRTNRVARRRRQREKARIGYLRELFANEIQKTDPGFFQRLDDSKYFQEDKMIHQPFALFADSGYTDKEYFQEYPTIYHLRKELLTSTEPHDVRLVYLAVLNMFKHRGHFLNASLTDESIGNLADLFENLRITVKDQLDVELAYPERIEELENIFVRDGHFKNLMITVLSFGFKYGIPADADLVFDVRFLPNPYYIERLRPLSGRDDPVREYVMGFEAAGVFEEKLTDMIRFLIPNYIEEGKNQLVIAIGCTGGRHRSVALAEELYRRLKNSDEYGIRIEHRDIDKDAVRKRM